MDLRQQIEDAVEENLRQVQKIKEYLHKRFDGGHAKFLAKDFAEVEGMLDGISEKTNDMGDLVTKGCLEDVTKLLTGLVEKAGSKTSRPSYADAVAGGSMKPAQSVMTGEKTLIINKGFNNISVEELYSKVNKGIRTLRVGGNQVKINRVIKGKTSVIVKIQQKENIDQLIENFKKIDELNNNARIYQARQLDPVVVFKGVSAELKNEELIQSICEMNDELNGKEDKFIFKFEMKSKSHLRGVVFRVAPSVYQILMNLGRVFAMNQIIKVDRKVLVRQCQKCYSFAHGTKQCNVRARCHTCGEHEQGHKCNNILKCANCAHHPKYKDSNINHPPNSNACPLYETQIKRVLQDTNYDGSDDYFGETPMEDETSKTNRKRDLSPSDSEDHPVGKR